MRTSGNSKSADLPDIPLIDLGSEGPQALCRAEPKLLVAIMHRGRDHYGPAAVSLGDRLSRRWLAKAANPYLAEIDAVSEAVGEPGAHLLNLSYEWACTSGIGPDPDGPGSRLLRTLDWPLHGLGENLVVARHQSEAGEYYNVTWPGFAGVLTAMAPGRFSAAINQPPLRRFTPSCWFDWLIGRLGVWRQRELPPVHLLRRVFDTCRTYEDARRMLTETPIAMPAFISLSGAEASEGCVIERGRTSAAVRDAPCSVANHWIAGSGDGHPRGWDSPGRWQMMEDIRQTAAADLSWVAPPILNPTTRLAVAANASTGMLVVQGWEADGPATNLFRL